MRSHPISVIVIIEVVGLDKKEMVWMAKVSIEVHSGTARFTVAIKAQSMRQALSLVTARHPSSVTRVKFPVDPGRVFVEDSAAA
jgi:hypothetical protein